MDCGYLEEGDRCPEKMCRGIMNFVRQDSCSCHINPPCSACVNALLVCSDCGFVDDSEPEKYVAVAPGLSMLVHKPMPLDSTKIDWRNKMHTNSSMIKEGVYPEGTTRAEAEAMVKGTFGGRFKSFGDGRFTYIAYTD